MQNCRNRMQMSRGQLLAKIKYFDPIKVGSGGWWEGDLWR